jgi:hypothetical protein
MKQEEEREQRRQEEQLRREAAELKRFAYFCENREIFKNGHVTGA